MAQFIKVGNFYFAQLGNYHFAPTIYSKGIDNDIRICYPYK